MIFVCYGMPKSASTFVFQIAVRIAQTHSNQADIRKSLPKDLQDTFINKDLGKTLIKINEYLPKTGEIYVVKTHCPLSPEVKNLWSKGEIKAVASYRDPYDIVVSLKDAGEIERKKELNQQRSYFTNIKDYGDALKEIPFFLKVAKSWLDCEDTLNISFSQVVKEPVILAQEIATYMGVDIEAKKIENIVESYTSNKSSIFEFNVGLEGRGHQEFSLPEEDPIKQKMDRFLKLYF